MSARRLDKPKALRRPMPRPRMLRENLEALAILAIVALAVSGLSLLIAFAVNRGWVW